LRDWKASTVRARGSITANGSQVYAPAHRKRQAEFFAASFAHVILIAARDLAFTLDSSERKRAQLFFA
jgi:hypothetical protein